MSYCPDCKQELRIGNTVHSCPERRQREANDRLARTACSPSSTPETDAHIDALNDDWDVEMASITTLARRLETERNEAREQLYRIVREGFGLDDTITGETCAEYVLRRLGKIPENA